MPKHFYKIKLPNQNLYWNGERFWDSSPEVFKEANLALFDESGESFNKEYIDALTKDNMLPHTLKILKNLGCKVVMFKTEIIDEYEI
jgi:hypothetical protein